MTHSFPTRRSSDLFEDLRNQGHKSWMAVGQRRHDHPDIFRLPDARWREAALGMLGPMVDSLWGAERVRRKVQQLTSPRVLLDQFRGREPYEYVGKIGRASCRERGCKCV